MGFLRRLLGGNDGDAPSEPSDPSASDAAPTADAAERAYELDLLRGEQERLDELVQRQLRYAAHAWQPPDQGGSRRADDEGADGG